MINMAFLYGWQRKLAVLPLSLFMLGWSVYSAGFIWKLFKWDENLHNYNFTVVTSRYDPLVFPYYVALVGGPFVFLLSLLHTVLPGVASSIIGFLSAIVSNIFFVSNGWVIYYWGLYLKSTVDVNLSVDAKAVLMFGGALFAALCWCFVMMLSVSYTYKRRPDPFSYNGLLNHNSDGPGQGSSDRIRNLPFTPGIARIFSLPFIILSAIGWCVFVAGVDKLPKLQSNGYPTSQSFFHLSFYGSMVVGPLLYLAALLHAGCLRSASIVMGAFTSVLHTIYIVFMGYIVTEFGRYIYFSCQESTSVLPLNCSLLYSSMDINVIYVFSGGVGSLFFWTLVLALWPFYRRHVPLADNSDSTAAAINSAASPITYGTMQMKESFTYSSYSTHHPRQSLLIAESDEHK